MEKKEIIKKKIEERNIPNIKSIEVIKSDNYYVAIIKNQNGLTSEALYDINGNSLTDFTYDSCINVLPNDYISILYLDNQERTVVYQVVGNELQMITVCEKVETPKMLLDYNSVLLRNYEKVRVLSLEDGTISREYQSIEYQHNNEHFPIGEAYIYLEEKDDNDNKEKTAIQGFVDHTGTPISWFLENSCNATTTYPFDKMKPYEIDEELENVRNRLKDQLKKNNNQQAYGKLIYQKLKKEMGFGDK